MILKVCSICGNVYHKDGMCPKCNIPLGDYTTQELVDELCKRDGVITKKIEKYMSFCNNIYNAELGSLLSSTHDKNVEATILVIRNE